MCRELLVICMRPYKRLAPARSVVDWLRSEATQHGYLGCLLGVYLVIGACISHERDHQEIALKWRMSPQRWHQMLIVLRLFAVKVAPPITTGLGTVFLR